MTNENIQLDFRIMYASVLIHWSIIIVSVVKSLIFHQPSDILNMANFFLSIMNGVVLASDAYKRNIMGWTGFLLFGSVIPATVYLFKRNQAIA